MKISAPINLRTVFSASWILNPGASIENLKNCFFSFFPPTLTQIPQIEIFCTNRSKNSTSRNSSFSKTLKESIGNLNFFKSILEIKSRRRIRKQEKEMRRRNTVWKSHSKLLLCAMTIKIKFYFIWIHNNALKIDWKYLVLYLIYSSIYIIFIITLIIFNAMLEMGKERNWNREERMTKKITGWD